MAEIYVVKLPGSGVRIGFDGDDDEQLTAHARRLRQMLLRIAFEDRDIFVIDFSGSPVAPYWSQECGAQPFRRRDRPWSSPHWAVYVASTTAACLDKLSHDSEFETESLAVTALSQTETTKELEDAVCRSLRNGSWPINKPRPVESFHVADDALVIWWGYPERDREAEEAVVTFAEDNGLALRVLSARSHAQLVDRFFPGNASGHDRDGTG